MTKLIKLQWKDPDWSDGLREQVGRDIPDELWEQLSGLGLGEYLDIEVDTEANTAKIVRSREDD